MRVLQLIGVCVAALAICGCDFELSAMKQKAESGDATAQANLGQMYNDGPRDYAEALKWFRLAADQGNAKGQNGLGCLYLSGCGVPRDYAEALKWFRLAADQGYAKGQTNLGLMYEHGYGVPQDYAEALKWYRLAADQGEGLTMVTIGRMYSSGKGVPQDYVEAYAWYSVVADNDFGWGNTAGESRDFVAKKLTPDQVAAAKKRAADLLKKIESGK